MKTFRFLFTIMVCLILASCASDEQKALNYVKTEVMPTDSVEHYLIAYTIQKQNTEFWDNLAAYFGNALRNGKQYTDALLCNTNAIYYDVSWPDGWGHRDKHGYKLDIWVSNSGEFDSDKILQEIHSAVSDAITGKNEYNTESSPLGWGSYDEFDWYNLVLMECVKKSLWYIKEELGEAYSYDDWKKHEYDWTTKNIDERNSFIDDLASFIAYYSIESVKEKKYKLIDAQGIKTGENNFKITYLLEPKIKIMFDITKVGKTFTCDNIAVEGSIPEDNKE